MLNEHTTALTDEQLVELRNWSGCLVADAIETLHIRRRNGGFADSSLHSLFPHLPSMVGYAATVRIRASTAPETDGIYPDRSDWWDYVLSMPSPRVVVVQDCGARPGISSLLGAAQINILRVLGCVGAVTNGAVRDIPKIAPLHFPVFAANVVVSHAFVEIIDMGGPVEVSGLKIHPGDLLHGDLHGVQLIPADVASDIPQAALQIATDQEMLISVCQSPDFSLEKLQAAVARTRY